MTYPNSAPVIAGQATEAAQYNNLRMDALYLGGDPAESGTLRDLLYSSSGSITLQQSGTAGVQLVASDSGPAAVMIEGQIFSVAQNLTYTMTADDFPAAGYYAIYAAGGSDGRFTLGVGSAIPAHARKIGGLIWTGEYIVRGSIRNELMEAIYLGKNPFVCNGRLTLASAAPIPESDIVNAEELYFTPFGGNEVSLYLGGQWVVFAFSEISMSLSGLQQEIPYDIFLTTNSAGLTLAARMWGSASVRSVALERQDGILVSSASRTERYLGTICINAAGRGEDSKTGRMVWNEYNRVARPILAPLVTSKTQGAGSMNNWVPYYNEDAPIVRMLVPKADCDFEIFGVGKSSPVSESDRGYLRSYAIGVLQDPTMESPYTGNSTCADVFLASFGNTPDICKIGNTGSKYIGYHRYALGYWSNYSFYPTGTAFKTTAGETPGLVGKIWG